MLENDLRAEIVALHEFFVDWFGGLIAQDDQIFNDRFVVRFGDECELIQPSGATLTRKTFIAAVRNSYGSSPDFKIAIRNVRLRFELPGGHALVSYEEWQRNAVNSTPQDNARAASVLFSRTSANTPFQWLHIHETWLPSELTNASKFNF